MRYKDLGNSDRAKIILILVLTLMALLAIFYPSLMYRSSDKIIAPATQESID